MPSEDASISSILETDDTITNNQDGEDDDIECNLIFHGAAASSSSHSLVYLKQKDVLVYASHGIVNLATKTLTSSNSSAMRDVHQTLRTNGSISNKDSSNSNVITCLTQVQDYNSTTSTATYSEEDTSSNTVVTNDIVCGFSNGACNLWWWQTNTNAFVEDIIDTNTNTTNSNTDSKTLPTYSVTDIAAMKHIPILTATATATTNDTTIAEEPSFYKNSSSSLVLVVTASCTGVRLYSRYANSETFDTTANNNNWFMQQPPLLTCANSSVATVLLQRHDTLLLLFTGSAIPRANRIRVFSIEPKNEFTVTTLCTPLWEVTYHGHLLGHQDWITCMDWTTMNPNNTSNTTANQKSYLLATGSQDAKIRLWKFLHYTARDGSTSSTSTTTAADNNNSNNTLNDEGLVVVDEDDDSDFLLDEQQPYEEDEEARLILQHSPSNINKTAVTLEAILVGHEDTVTSVSWQQSKRSSNVLLSSSMDCSILLWSLEEDDSEKSNNSTKPTSSCWIPHARIGVAGGILGASIGSSLLGFVDAIWLGDTTIVGHGYGGTLYFWSCYDEEQTHGRKPNQQQHWKAQPPLTGHFRPVNDLSWEPTNGEFLLTVSSDQTCRLIAPIPKSTLPTTATCIESGNNYYWREVGRPQVHGYDIHAVSCIGIGEEPFGRFISGSSEKQLRAFDAPCATIRLLDQICNPSKENYKGEVLTSRLKGRAEKSFLPSLGLTNKAVGEDDDEIKGEYYSHNNEEDFITTPLEEKDSSVLITSATVEDILPRERELGMSTLWPETKQLFGHPSDLICIASTSSCKNNIGRGARNKPMVIIASSCKARNSEQASIRLWNVSRGSCLGTLKDGHQSTVVAIGFSNDEKYLASSGKDRRICLWQRKSSGDASYQLVAVKSLAHKRIIWTLHWCPQDPTVFATGSRDGLVKIWKVAENPSQPEINQVCSFEPMAAARKKEKQQQHDKQLVEPVTAVSFSPVAGSGFNAILGVGLESGKIELWSLVFNECNGDYQLSCSIMHRIKTSDCHLGAVKKIEWRPTTIEDVNASCCKAKVHVTLATCSLDHGVRIFDLIFKR